MVQVLEKSQPQSNMLLLNTTLKKLGKVEKPKKYQRPDVGVKDSSCPDSQTENKLVNNIAPGTKNLYMKLSSAKKHSENSKMQQKTCKQPSP